MTYEELQEQATKAVEKELETGQRPFTCDLCGLSLVGELRMHHLGLNTPFRKTLISHQTCENILIHASDKHRVDKWVLFNKVLRTKVLTNNHDYLQFS